MFDLSSDRTIYDCINVSACGRALSDRLAYTLPVDGSADNASVSADQVASSVQPLLRLKSIPWADGNRDSQQVYNANGHSFPNVMAHSDCDNMTSPSAWPPPQLDEWRSVETNDDAVFVYSAFLTPRHTVAVVAIGRNFSAKHAYYCQYWQKGVNGFTLHVRNATMLVNRDAHGMR